MSNGSGDANSNRVNIGARNSYLVSAFAGYTADPGYGNVAIGKGIIPGATGNLATKGTANFISSELYAGLNGRNFGNHSLYVTGIQTIGTNDPLSAFSASPSTTGALVGNYSLLKIHRNLADDIGFAAKGTSVVASGDYPNSYPNGLEITSYKRATNTSTPNVNGSVAIAVASANTLYNVSGGQKVPTPTTGFFVSDDGKQVAIGTQLNTGNALQVNGVVGITGTTNIQGGLSVTGDTDIVGNFSVTGDVSIVDNTPTMWGNTATSSPRWANNLSGGASTTAFDLPSENYDRVVHVVTSTNGPVDVQIYVETSPGSFTLVGRCTAYSSACAIIPAGRKWRLWYDGTGHSGANPTLSNTIFKLGK